MSAEIRRLLETWRNRAEPNFADPEATEDTLDYWRGVKRCADELDALLGRADEHPATAGPSLAEQEAAEAFYRLAVQQRDAAWREIERLQQIAIIEQRQHAVLSPADLASQRPPTEIECPTCAALIPLPADPSPADPPPER